MRLLALAAIMALLVGCTKVETATATGRHPWTQPGVLRIADIADPDKFNPLLSTMDLVEDLSSLVLSYLVIADDHGKLIGDLASEVPTLKNGGISADGTTITYHLHTGVLWHDGVPFSSKDVKFTWEAVMNSRNNVFHREGYEEVASIDTPDPATVVVHLKRRFPPFVSEFFTTLQEGSKGILPEHILAKLPNINQADYNSHPIGTGPFKFVSWDRGRSMSFVRNLKYFKGVPKLERIEFTVIPDDNTILQQIQTHDVDMVVSVASALYQRYKALPGVKTKLYPWNAMSVMPINNSRPGLRHLAVRQALAMAIDYESIINKITHGVGTLAHDIVPTGSVGYTENAPYRYDPKAAAKLLDEHGWKPGPDGIRQKNGERLDFTLTLAAGGATARALAVPMQQWLHAIGMNLTIKAVPYNVIFSYEGPVQTGRFDFTSYGYTMPYDPDNYAYLGCDQFPDKGENVFRFCDPQIDAGERAGLLSDDPEKRDAIYKPVERRIHALVPYIPLYIARRPTAFNDDLQNYSAAPGIAPWWNAWQWSI